VHLSCTRERRTKREYRAGPGLVQRQPCELERARRGPPRPARLRSVAPAGRHIARTLAAGLALSNRARFVEANVYDALQVMPPLHDFDMVYVTWGAL